MAKPILKTPTLKGKAANIFIAEMLHREKRKINAVEKEFVNLISKH